MEEEQLRQRLEATRSSVAEQRKRLRAARLRGREVEAAASARSDRAAAGLLRARGHAAPDPPVPAHPPAWADAGASGAGMAGERDESSPEP